MSFEILGDIVGVETIAIEGGIREVDRLRRLYGIGRWRKRKGFAIVQLGDEAVRRAEIHWYEASGIGNARSRSSAFWNRS